MIKADRQKWTFMAWTNITKKIDLNVDSAEFMDSPKKTSCKDNIYPKIKTTTKVADAKEQKQ
jgi:hypothetical protein